jgi:SOS response regulatory protein OraA/RecX
VRSRQEVRTFLALRGASADAIGRLLNVCEERGLLNDRACARLWAGQWARRGYAASVIHQRLHEKAIDAETIADAIKTIARASDDAARARLLVARHLGRRGSPPRSRLARTLASRGFDPDVIEQVLHESFGTSSDEQR